MKKLFFILFFVPLISYCQTDSEFIFHDSITVKRGINCISLNDCFYFSNDDKNPLFLQPCIIHTKNMKLSR